MAVNTVSKGIPIVGPILNLLIGSRNERFVKRYTARVEAINSLEPQTRKLTDAQIRAMIVEFRQRSEKGEPAADMLDEALAVAREAMDRAVGIRNIFNPKFEHLFNPDKLPADARAMYEQVKQEIAARPPAPPTGEFLGCTEPQPSVAAGGDSARSSTRRCASMYPTGPSRPSGRGPLTCSSSARWCSPAARSPR